MSSHGQTLLSFLKQCHELTDVTADILKDDIRTIKERMIDNKKAILEKDRMEEAIRLSKTIVKGFDGAISKAVKELNSQAIGMIEDLGKRFNLPPDWHQSQSTRSLLSGSNPDSKVSGSLGMRKDNISTWLISGVKGAAASEPEVVEIDVEKSPKKIVVVKLEDEEGASTSTLSKDVKPIPVICKMEGSDSEGEDSIPIVKCRIKTEFGGVSQDVKVELPSSSTKLTEPEDVKVKQEVIDQETSEEANENGSSAAETASASTADVPIKREVNDIISDNDDQTNRSIPIPEEMKSEKTPTNGSNVVPSTSNAMSQNENAVNTPLSRETGSQNGKLRLSGNRNRKGSKKKPLLSRGRSKVPYEMKEEQDSDGDDGSSVEHCPLNQDTICDQDMNDDKPKWELKQLAVLLKKTEVVERALKGNGTIELEELKMKMCEDMDSSSGSEDDFVQSLRSLLDKLKKGTYEFTKKCRMGGGGNGQTGDRSSQRRGGANKGRGSNRKPENEELYSDTGSDSDDTTADTMSLSRRASPMQSDDDDDNANGKDSEDFSEDEDLTYLTSNSTDDSDENESGGKKPKVEKSKSNTQANDSKRKKYYQPHFSSSSDESGDGDSDSAIMRDLLGPSEASESGGKKKKRSKSIRKDKASDSSEGSGCSSRIAPSDFHRKRKEVATDSETDDAITTIRDSDDDQNDSDFKHKSRKKRNLDSSAEEVERSKKRRRILSPSSETSDSDDIQDLPGAVNGQEGPVVVKKRRTRKIIKSKDLSKTTKEAEKEEEERRRRVLERQELIRRVLNGLDVSDRLILDVDVETNEPSVEVDKSIVRHLKPHQVDGVKFMYNACFESVDMIKDGKIPGGCILAHCMGLGKTLQAVALTHTLLTNPLSRIKTVLVICPLSTVTNWFNESKAWTKDAASPIKLHRLYKLKDEPELKSRIKHLKAWQQHGGVGILNYDMFRLLTTDPDPEGKNNQKQEEALRTEIRAALLDPGPDMVICDEGHMLKNRSKLLTQAVNNIRTLRRIVLTGTPLQNSLDEYHTMLDFVKPNLLGTVREFKNRFVNPIRNGQHADSGEGDVSLMKKRAHILHRKLEGCVQRRDYSTLAPYLPPKYEYVIKIKLSQKQEQLYKLYLANLEGNPEEAKLKLFSHATELGKVCSHPVALGGRTVSKKRRTQTQVGNEVKEKWWNSILGSKRGMDDDNEVELSGKLIILKEILSKCRGLGERVLIFSQYLISLDIIENFLAKWDKQGKGKQGGRWRRDKEYFRIDGKTDLPNRHEYCEEFNSKSSSLKLFLISTKVGGLGINLFGANRVIIFDVSWNPSQDMQSIFRAYRFGQEKPCYIYRLIARGTIEEKILRNQITKLSLSSRVVDEHQIKRHFTVKDVNELYRYDEETPSSSESTLDVPKDDLLADLLLSHRDWIRSYEEFDSLLENKLEEGLSDEEKAVAWAEYQVESERRKAKQQQQPTTNSSSSTQADPTMYEKIRTKLITKYPSATKEQIEQATNLTVQVLNKIRLARSSPRGDDEDLTAPLQQWLVASVAVDEEQSGNIVKDVLGKKLPDGFYQISN